MISFKQFFYEQDSIDLSTVDTKLEYHDALNPAIWNDMELKNDVKIGLTKIADAFIDFLEISKQSIKDIIITGSNCGYNYTPLSDIDLHLVIDFGAEDLCPSCVGDFVTDCFHAKKSLWNSQHDITIFGYNVELYAQSAAEKHIAPGVFSLMTEKWIITPTYERPNYDSTAVKSKAAEIMNSIDMFVDSKSDNIDDIKSVKDKIYQMRKAGLQQFGEYSVENLAFKTLRNNGYLDKLNRYLTNIQDKSLSIK